MTERRYNEDEVAAIFERATEPSQANPAHASSSEGMTLAELQEIGREVGIAPESIALAARSVGVAAQASSRTFLGLPLGVARTVQLDRRLSEEEWERLVVVLRETFNARGNVRSQGSLRQWTNGNLQALLEPTERGHRVRMRTTKGDAMAWLTLGLGMVGFSAVSLVAAAVGAVGDVGMLAATGLTGVAGAGLFTATALRLPRWARTRQKQMEEVAARVALGTSPAPPVSD